MTDRTRQPDDLDFRALAEAVPQVVWIADASGVPVFFNRHWTAYTGLSVEQSLADGWRRSIHPDDGQRFQDAWNAALAGRNAYSLELRLRNAEGQYRWCVVRAVPSLDDGGAVACWHGTATDIHELRLAEQRWKFALEGSSQGVWDWDRAHGTVYQSPQYRRMLGYAPEEYRGSDESAFAEVHPEDRPRMRAILDAYIRGGSESCFAEYRIRRRDGQYIWVESRGQAVERGAQGVPLRLIGTHTDVTQRVDDTAALRRLSDHLEEEVLERTAEVENEKARLAASEAKFRTLFEQAPIGIGVGDRVTGRLLDVNARACEIIGYPREELLGSDLLAISRPDDVVLQQSLLDQMHRGELGTINITKRYLRRDGSVTWVDVTASPSAAARDAGDIVMLQDVTARKRSELDLQAALGQLELALKAGSLGIWSRELPDGPFLADARVCELYDVPPEIGEAGVPYTAFRARLHPEDAPRVEQLISDSERLGLPMEDVYRVTRPDGSVRHLHVATAFEIAADGAPVRVVGVVRDVTQQVEMENSLRDASLKIESANQALTRNRHELEKTVRQRTVDLEKALEQAQGADRAKNAFLATASHELRTPLNAVIGFSSLLLDGQIGPLSEQQRKPLAIIHRSGEQLLALVKDILDMTSIEAGNLRVSPTEVRPSEVLEEQVAALQQRASERSLALRPVHCDAGIVVVADRERMSQAVRNLVSNALTYTDAGHVQLQAAIVGKSARVEVIDTGIGIPLDQQDKLFKPFMRINGQPGPLRQRTGLGLAISRRIVEAMGGTIGCESEPGGGSRFWFTVPLAGRSGRSSR